VKPESNVTGNWPSKPIANARLPRSDSANKKRFHSPIQLKGNNEMAEATVVYGTDEFRGMKFEVPVPPPPPPEPTRTHLSVKERREIIARFADMSESSRLAHRSFLFIDARENPAIAEFVQKAIKAIDQQQAIEPTDKKRMKLEHGRKRLTNATCGNFVGHEADVIGVTKEILKELEVRI